MTVKIKHAYGSRYYLHFLQQLQGSDEFSRRLRRKFTWILDNIPFKRSVDETESTPYKGLTTDPYTISGINNKLSFMIDNLDTVYTYTEEYSRENLVKVRDYLEQALEYTIHGSVTFKDMDSYQEGIYKEEKE